MREQECCPRFNPKPWNGKSFEWKNKKFIRGKVRTAPAGRDSQRSFSRR